MSVGARYTISPTALTGWQFDDGARRLIARLEKSDIWS